MNGELSGNGSYSQLGEDLIAEFVFQGFLGREKPLNFLDVGSNHPIKLNNTYRFYLKGVRGVLVEPNPFLIEESRRLRNEDVCLNAAISLKNESSVDFYLMEPHQFSTIDSFAAKSCQQNGQAHLSRILKVPAYSINEIIESYCGGELDLLNIDVEGIDFEILQNIDFRKYRPKLIIVETWDVDEKGKGRKRSDIINFMLKENYCVMADTILNTVFLSRSQSTR